MDRPIWLLSFLILQIVIEHPSGFYLFLAEEPLRSNNLILGRLTPGSSLNHHLAWPFS